MNLLGPEPKNNFEELSRNIETLNRRLTGSWHALWRGILSGFGYVVGAIMALALLGWVLNVVGIIPSLRQQVSQWQTILQQVQTKETIKK